MLPDRARYRPSEHERGSDGRPVLSPLRGLQRLRVRALEASPAVLGRCRAGGDSDETTADDLDAWRHHTEGQFALHVLRGGHFYIRSEEAALLAIIERELRRHVPLG